MLLDIFTVLFGICSCILTIQLLMAFFKIHERMSTMNSSRFISSIAGSFFLYVINAIALVILLPQPASKLVMAFFCITPFIIGVFATYERLKLYSIIQILCVIISGAYVLII